MGNRSAFRNQRFQGDIDLYDGNLRDEVASQGRRRLLIRWQTGLRSQGLLSQHSHQQTRYDLSVAFSSWHQKSSIQVDCSLLMKERPIVSALKSMWEYQKKICVWEHTCCIGSQHLRCLMSYTPDDDVTRGMGLRFAQIECIFIKHFKISVKAGRTN